MTKTTYSERLTQAMHAAGLTQGALAKAVGMSQSSIWKLTSGAASGSRRTVEIAKVLGVRPDWLASGELPEREVDDPEKRGAHYQALPDDTYRVDVLDIQASAGPGSFVSSEFIETIRAIEYTTEQARLMFAGRPADHVKVITVRGDSMEGTINPGDHVFVDTSVNHFDGDGVYVFVYGKTIHIKRLQMLKTSLVVLSDNKLYNSWQIDESDEDQFHVLAKVLLKQSSEIKRFA